MKRTAIMIAGLALAAAATPLFAEGPLNLYVKGGLVSSQGDARDMTNNGHGYTLEFGYTGAPESWKGLQYRVYAGMVTMPGDAGFKPWLRVDQGNGSEVIPYSEYQAMSASQQSSMTVFEQKFSYDLRGNFFGFDMIHPFTVGSQSFTAFLGPSLHQWFVTRVNPNATQGDRNWRAGWRLGLGYPVTKDVDLNLAYVFTEWRSKNSATMTYEKGGNPSRPAYLTLTASYHF
ncbi:hypothetical protein GETHLI_02580 [Geothrix limicola]|uniref:Outer membrane protein beta-barrel domain-containing protein n=1 Tax=Geothrix limicola TaxID=2927978 RepID=A0ABQ5QBL4_9BACT|nr:hypothetical protein [Geothrix limicola]GLH71756.1 hypothetical protein GETHLI_02580 [Geothrix limicola]